MILLGLSNRDIAQLCSIAEYAASLRSSALQICLRTWPRPYLRPPRYHGRPAKRVDAPRAPRRARRFRFRLARSRRRPDRSRVSLSPPILLFAGQLPVARVRWASAETSSPAGRIRSDGPRQTRRCRETVPRAVMMTLSTRPREWPLHAIRRVRGRTAGLPLAKR